MEVFSPIALMPFFFSKEHWSWFSADSSLPAIDRFFPEKFSSTSKGQSLQQLIPPLTATPTDLACMISFACM